MLVSSSKSEQLAYWLINKSHIKPTNYEKSIKWSLNVNKSLRPKNLDHLWIKGLDFEKQLTDEQRLEVAWLEIARDVSMFIWFEQTLIPIYTNYVSKFGEDINPEIRDYLSIFAKEEIVHVLCFRRYMNMAKLPYFPPPSSYIGVFNELHKLHPIMAILITLLTEWVAENVAMFSTQENYVDPLTRQLFCVHHSDEVRHISFGRKISEDFFHIAPDHERRKILSITKEMLNGLLRQFTYNSDISKLVSFNNPILPYEDISEVLNSENNLRINKIRFKDILQWITKLENIVYQN